MRKLQNFISIGRNVTFMVFAGVFGSSSADTVLEEVIVTATKRATVLQDTSESIQALTASDLSEIGANDFIDYFRLVPNLSQSENLGPGNARYAVRGISSAGEPLVAVYFDESPTLGSPGDNLDAGGSQPDIKLWDIERIEVLKGPQGTLYGSGSMGGTIRVISNKPDASAVDFAVQGGFESIESGGEGFTGNAMVNLPIIEDQLAIRLTGYHHNIDGYLDEAVLGDNDTNDEETTGGRFAARWTPNDKFTLTSTTYYQDTEAGSNYEVFEGFGDEEDPTAAQLSRTPYKDEILLSNITAEYSFDWMDALYSFSYFDREVERHNDQTRFVIYQIAGVPRSVCPESALADGSCYALVNAGPFGTVAPLNSYGFERTVSRTHELRFTSTYESPLQWTIGAFYENRDNLRVGQVGATDANGDLVFNTDGTIQNRIFARTNWGDREHYAVFGELTYEFMPDWTAAFGIRWFKTDRQEVQNLVQNLGPGPTGMLPIETESENDAVFRFKLAWEVNDELLLYALAAEGFRVGGPNQPAGFDAFAPPFDSDSLWNYEFGWKSTWADNRIIFNGAAFYVDWSNVQYETTDITGAFQIIGNAGDASIPGFELEIQALVTDNFEVGAAVGYTHGRFDGTQPVQGLFVNQTADGDRFPDVPDWSPSMWAQYTYPLSGNFLNGFDLIVSGDWSYRSRKTVGLRPTAGNFRELDDYHLANIRAGLTSEHWDLWLRVNNLFDVLPELSGRLIDSEPYRFTSLQPRTVGLTVTYRY